MTRVPNRWAIAIAGVIMQVALGAIYAWSVFRIPLTQAFGWTIPQVTLTFTIAIFVLGFAAFAGGMARPLAAKAKSTNTKGQARISSSVQAKSV